MNKVTNIRLTKNVNFTDIEDLASKFLLDSPVKLQIPNKLSYSGGFGIEGAALQLLATWFRSSEHHVLHTAIQELSDNSFDDLCNSLFGLCALRLSDSILLAGKKQVSLAQALHPAIQIFKDIRSENFQKAFKGMYLTIPAIKSPVIKGGQDREFDSPLYNRDTVVGTQKFRQITLNALNATIPNASSIDSRIISHISEILRELFTNTHRHARTDIHGSPLDKNFRGIIFNTASLDGKRFDEILRSDGRDSSLFSIDWRPSENKLFKAIDITVVDSGPGYARRWTKIDKNELTIDMEKNAIVDCFKKYCSTDTTDSSGSGLSNVLADLRRLRGWFRLRTGRILVTKSFYNQKGGETIEYKDTREMDTFMEGVLFNVVIPFDSLFGEK
jgi:hypothetical protein